MGEKTRDDGGSAFPWGSGDPRDGSTGMSLRDYFAAQALPECIQLATTIGYSHQGGSKASVDGVHRLPWPTPAAECAYQVADAMIAERKK